MADNILWNQCGGNKSTYPQVTVYDNLALANASFGFYVNTTLPDLWEIVGGGWAEDKYGANYPDVMMDGVVRCPGLQLRPPAPIAIPIHAGVPNSSPG